MICEDVRFQLGGTLSLVGVVNERIIAPEGEGPIAIPKLACFAVVSGLRGIERLEFRQWLREASGRVDGPAQTSERHEALSDEHNFVFAMSPMVFPGPGAYEMGLEVEAGGERVQYTIGFVVERREV